MTFTQQVLLLLQQLQQMITLPASRFLSSCAPYHQMKPAISMPVHAKATTVARPAMCCGLCFLRKTTAERMPSVSPVTLTKAVITPRLVEPHRTTDSWYSREEEETPVHHRILNYLPYRIIPTLRRLKKLYQRPSAQYKEELTLPHSELKEIQSPNLPLTGVMIKIRCVRKLDHVSPTLTWPRRGI